MPLMWRRVGTIINILISITSVLECDIGPPNGPPQDLWWISRFILLNRQYWTPRPQSVQRQNTRYKPVITDFIVILFSRQCFCMPIWKEEHRNLDGFVIVACINGTFQLSEQVLHRLNVVSTRCKVFVSFHTVTLDFVPL